MNTVTNRETLQQTTPPITPMGRKLAGIRQLRNGADTGEIIRNEIALQQQQTAQLATQCLETLQETKEEITARINDACDEINAISPQDVVAGHLAHGASIITQLTNTQNELLLATEQAKARLEREKQEGAKLEHMLRDHEKEYRSASPIVPQEGALIRISDQLSKHIATGGSSSSQSSQRSRIGNTMGGSL